MRAPLVQWVWFHAIPRRKVAVLVAEGGTGKSGLLVGLAIYRALGLPFLGRETLPGRTFFLTAEDDHADYHRKIETWIRSGLLPATADLASVSRSIIVAKVNGLRRLLMGRSGEYDLAPLVQQTIELLQQGAIHGPMPDLVVLETASRFGIDETNEGAAALIAACEAICEATGAAVALVHHKGKSRDDRHRFSAYAARGASAYADNARASLLLAEIPDVRAAKAAGFDLPVLPPNLILFKVTRLSSGPPDRKGMLLERRVAGEGVFFQPFLFSAEDKAFAETGLQLKSKAELSAEIDLVVEAVKAWYATPTKYGAPTMSDVQDVIAVGPGRVAKARVGALLSSAAQAKRLRFGPTGRGGRGAVDGGIYLPDLPDFPVKARK